jgi:hypothetical protein
MCGISHQLLSCQQTRPPPAGYAVGRTAGRPAYGDALHTQTCIKDLEKKGVAPVVRSRSIFERLRLRNTGLH